MSRTDRSVLDNLGQLFRHDVATAAVGRRWSEHADPPVDGRPPDSWITFDTSG